MNYFPSDPTKRNKGKPNAGQQFTIARSNRKIGVVRPVRTQTKAQCLLCDGLVERVMLNLVGICKDGCQQGGAI